MKAGLSTIQQTLTPEAASVLNQSIAEASRRNHGQTTPLHVAATLLASPSGFLRQACIRSHPNSSHPLQCRALELCFSVALERLPTTTSHGGAAAEPPISNALMAALKRAQAHQRRGCPEQNQQPLLAIKVELEQLIISILDDPSVSRVMREASFSSPAVKATIEQLLNNSSSGNRHHHHIVNNPPPHEVYKLGGLCSPLDTNTVPFPPPKLGVGGGGGGGGGIGNSRMLTSPASQLSQPAPMPNRNMYLNPRLQQQQEGLGSQLSQPTSIPNRNMYLNPRLQQQQQQQGGVSGQLGNQRDEQLKKVVDIMLRSKKRNPVLVGEGEPEAAVKELFRRIENGEGPLQNVQVIPFDKEIVSDKSHMQSKINDLGGLIESRLANGSVILDLGDLKWLVEQPGGFGVAAAASGGVQQQQQLVSESGRAAVVEMGKLLARFQENSNDNKFWFIGTATCETYLRSQVYHPTMENDWDLQAVPIASRSPQPGMFPRLGTDRLLGNPVEPLIPIKSFPVGMPTLSSRLSENLNPARKMNCCLQCSEKYEEELGNLSKESENSSSDAKSDATRPPLPQWLQNAKIQDNHANGSDKSQGKDKELILKQKSQELQKKWRDSCLRLHPNFHRSERTASPALSLTSLHNPSLNVHQPFQPKLQATLNTGETPRLNTNPVARGTSEPTASPPGSPVRTDLVLGRKVTDPTPEANEALAKDFLGCISSEPETKLLDKFANSSDADTYKKLLKGLMEKAWWQAEAASGIASAVTRCRLGNGKRRGAGSRGDIWLLFTGPDRTGKRMMASVLSEQMCGSSPVVIYLGLRRDNEELDMNFRGKTALDRIAEAVRRNPFSVIMLEDIDEADLLVRGSIKRAIDRGRLTDSHGREISLGNVIFIVTGNWSTVSYENHGNGIDDGKLGTLRNGNWHLRLSLSEKSAKRRASWLHNEDRSTKPRKEMNPGLSLDLNLAADIEDDRTDGSHNSSDLTIDHEEELGLEDRHFAMTAVPHELVSSVDDAIVFKPVDFAFVRREIRKTITKKFSMAVEDKTSLQVEDAALEKIIVGLWRGKTSLEQWVEKVLAPSFDQLGSRLKTLHEGLIVQLALNPDVNSDDCHNSDQLPSEIRLMVD